MAAQRCEPEAVLTWLWDELIRVKTPSTRSKSLCCLWPRNWTFIPKHDFVLMLHRAFGWFRSKLYQLIGWWGARTLPTPWLGLADFECPVINSCSVSSQRDSKDRGRWLSLCHEAATEVSVAPSVHPNFKWTEGLISRYHAGVGFKRRRVHYHALAVEWLILLLSFRWTFKWLVQNWISYCIFVSSSCWCNYWAVAAHKCYRPYCMSFDPMHAIFGQLRSPVRVV